MQDIGIQQHRERQKTENVRENVYEIQGDPSKVGTGTGRGARGTGENRSISAGREPATAPEPAPGTTSDHAGMF